MQICFTFFVPSNLLNQTQFKLLLITTRSSGLGMTQDCLYNNTLFFGKLQTNLITYNQATFAVQNDFTLGWSKLMS